MPVALRADFDAVGVRALAKTSANGVIDDMTIRNLSSATQQSYIHAVSKFSRYFARSPEKPTLEDVRTYQVHLPSMAVSCGSLNQAVCALCFLYGVTLGQATIPERIPFAREPCKPPTVLSADEIVRFLVSVSSLKSRVALTTAYTAGLRVSEVVALKLRDIDSDRRVIRMRTGKAWGGYSRHPGFARRRESVDDGALYPRLDRPHCRIAATASPLDRPSLDVTPPE